MSEELARLRREIAYLNKQVELLDKDFAEALRQRNTERERAEKAERMVDGLIAGATRTVKNFLCDHVLVPATEEAVARLKADLEPLEKAVREVIPRIGRGQDDVPPQTDKEPTR